MSGKGYTMRVLAAPDYFWRDDPSQFPRTTWHAVAMGEHRAACGFGPYGHRLVTRIGEPNACLACVALVGASVVEELHFDAQGTLIPLEVSA